MESRCPVDRIGVLMVSYTAPPLYSGSGSQALRLAERLWERGIAVSFLTARHGIDLPARDSSMQVPVRRLPVFRIGKLRPLSFSFAAALHLLSRHRQYDIVHLHGAYWRIVPMILVAKLVGKRIVVKMTQMGTDDPLAIRRRRCGRMLLKAVSMADAVVATTAELAESYARSGLLAQHLVRIPNGVDTRVFSPPGDEVRRALRAGLGFSPIAPIVLFVGAVNWRKGVDVLFSAWRSVQERFPEAVLILIGPLSQSLQPYDRPFADVVCEAVADRVPPEHIHVLGRQADVQRYYQLADVFVLPSRMEGLSNALLEAMSCGLPAIATAAGGAPEVVKDGENGIVVPAGDARALSDAILRLIQHPERARGFGQAARRTILTRFPMEAVVDEYVRLYRSTKEEGSGR